MISKIHLLPTIPSRIWTRILVVAWLLLITFPLMRSAVAAIVPTGYWFTVRGVQIQDALVGECPAMSIDMTIRRPFVGRYIATLRRVDNDGDEIVPPVSSKVVSYSPRARVPFGATLAWWMEWTDCTQLAAGRYLVDTVWVIEPDKYARAIAATSNVFSLIARPLPLPYGPIAPFRPIRP